MGGIVSEKCNDLSKQIWDLCIMENIWILAVHIRGKQNTIADFMSRSLNEIPSGSFHLQFSRKL